MLLRLVSLLLLASFSLPSFSLNPRNKRPQNFRKKDHCVAYETEVTLMMMGKNKVFGKNCSFQMEVEKTGSRYILRVLIPVAAFYSGEKGRDKALPELLGVNPDGYLIFVSEKMTRVYLRKFRRLRKTRLKGKLSYGERVRRVSFNVSLDANKVMKGELSTQFRTFGIPPPKVAGGVVATVAPHLKLRFQFQVPKMPKEILPYINE